MLQNQLPSWKPRSFQKEGLKVALGQACCGFLLPPGAGKTSMIYMLFRILKEKGFIKRALVICPVRPMYRVWPNQKDMFAEFQHLKVRVLHGNDKDEALLDDDADICVINPEGLSWLFAANSENKPDPVRLKWLAQRFDMLVVDESTKFKNPQSNRFKLLRNFIPKFKRRYILTGSPTAKGLMDLFGQIYILDEGQSLGRYITNFRLKYFYPSGYGGYDWKPMPNAEERIAEAIAPLVFRRSLKEAEIDLPELVFDDIWVDLPKPARAIYNDMEMSLVARMEEGAIVADNQAVASGKCRQIANGCLINTDEKTFSYVHDEKLKALEDLLEQLQGDPVLITYEFIPDMERVTKLLKPNGVPIPNISSGNAKRDDNNIRLFSEGMLPAVMGNPASIALGIDGLQKNCSHIAMMGCTWKAEDYQQVIDRVRRQGSTAKRVFVHRILARNTVDEIVAARTDGRLNEQELFMGLLRRLGR